MALKGKQSKLDANKNGKIDRDDFSLLKKKKAASKPQGKKQAMPRKKGM